MKWLKVVSLSVAFLLLSFELAFGFSTHDTMAFRVFDKVDAEVGESIRITVNFTNLETEDLKGFYYAEHVPEELTVTSVSVKLDGSEVSNYVFEIGDPGDVYPGCVGYRWVCETPSLFEEGNPISSGSTVEVAYTVSSGEEGSFELSEFHWVGYYPGAPEGETAAFGHSEEADEETITFLDAGPCVCNDADGDGYGDPACELCAYPELDCDDTDSSIHPGAEEVCDGIDNNCIGGTDEEPDSSDSCENGFFCDGDEYCDSGSCRSETNPCPSDGLFCNGTESCDEMNDECLHSGNPCIDDGLFCNGAESCDENSDQCLHSGDPCSDDGLWCNGTESCDENNDQCLHSGRPCDDGNVCTNDICNETQEECIYTCNATDKHDQCCTNPACADALVCRDCLNNNDCDDGLWCNGSESCVDGVCVAGEDPCPDDRLFCNGAESCDENSDQCLHSGDPCSDDGLWCNGQEDCNEVWDRCAYIDVPNCDDQNDCTHDSCNESADSCRNVCNATATDDPCCDDPACSGNPVCESGDSDGDGLADSLDPCPLDADCDDDGLTDGNLGSEDLNVNGVVDPRETDPRLFDTDGDGLSDGCERGLALPENAEATDPTVFVADEDPTTTTDPANPDSDGDGISDGEEDTNRNGRLDPGETDPNDGVFAGVPVTQGEGNGGCTCSVSESDGQMNFHQLIVTGSIYLLPAGFVWLRLRRIRRKSWSSQLTVFWHTR